MKLFNVLVLVLMLSSTVAPVMAADQVTGFCCKKS